jgi:hypothetical protein
MDPCGVRRVRGAPLGPAPWAAFPRSSICALQQEWGPSVSTGTEPIWGTAQETSPSRADTR